MTDPASENWHLDKRVPLALILTIVVQTVGFVWYEAQQNAQVKMNTRNIASMSTNADRILRLEANAEFQTETLKRIETKLDRLDQRLDEQP